MSSITSPSDFGKIAAWEELRRWVTNWAGDVTNQINGNVDFTSNIRCKIVDVKFNVANLEQQVIHGLGKVPVGYILVGSTIGCVVYNGGTEWNATTLSLAGSATSTCKILVF